VPPLPRLIALTPGTLSVEGFGAFLAALERALEAGLPGVLLREPRLPDRAFLELGREVGRLRALRPALWLAVHDRAHLAVELGADALHLSFRSLRPAELRPWLDPHLALGLSTHAHDDPGPWAEADYLFHGPLHATPSKTGRLEPVGFAGLERALALARRPLFALGGVRPADAREARRLGAHGVAVLAGVFGAEDPARATSAYLESLGRARPA
jgi:thiamine-phosphate pyrophosphorylase